MRRNLKSGSIRRRAPACIRRGALRKPIPATSCLKTRIGFWVPIFGKRGSRSHQPVRRCHSFRDPGQRSKAHLVCVSDRRLDCEAHALEKRGKPSSAVHDQAHATGPAQYAETALKASPISFRFSSCSQRRLKNPRFVYRRDQTTGILLSAHQFPC
jgi:hypothetical protein